MENELLDLSKETTYAEKVELLGKLLDSESTLFSKKMRDWLVKDGTHPHAVSFVSPHSIKIVSHISLVLCLLITISLSLSFSDALKVLIHYVTRPAKTEGQQEATDNGLPFTILNSEEYIISSNKRRDALLASEAEKKELREVHTLPEPTPHCASGEGPNGTDLSFAHFVVPLQLQKQNGEEDSLEDEDEDDDFAFSKEAKRADKAAEVFVYQAGSLPQDFIDKNLEDIGIPPPSLRTPGLGLFAHLAPSASPAMQ